MGASARVTDRSSKLRAWQKSVLGVVAKTLRSILGHSVDMLVNYLPRVSQLRQNVTNDEKEALDAIRANHGEPLLGGEAARATEETRRRR